MRILNSDLCDAFYCWCGNKVDPDIDLLWMNDGEMDWEVSSNLILFEFKFTNVAGLF
jgi:hypothetical protein